MNYIYTVHKNRLDTDPEMDPFIAGMLWMPIGLCRFISEKSQKKDGPLPTGTRIGTRKDKRKIERMKKKFG
jgi:hypothetical protein